MKTVRLLFFCLLLVADAAFLAGCRDGRSVAVVSEVANLTNLIAFCEPPSGVSGMESTYDRQGGNADWWVVPRPVAGSTDLYEMFRMDGPGCIKRIWNTNVPVKEWLFFFDGETKPRWTTQSIFPPSSLNCTSICWWVSGGAFSYLPVPFAKSIRILARIPDISPDSRLYFQINYERYSSGTQVATWPTQINTTLSNSGPACSASSGCSLAHHDDTVNWPSRACSVEWRSGS